MSGGGGGGGEGITTEGLAERVTLVKEIPGQSMQEAMGSGVTVAHILFTRDSVKLEPLAPDGNGADPADEADKKIFPSKAVTATSTMNTVEGDVLLRGNEKRRI